MEDDGMFLNFVSKGGGAPAPLKNTHEFQSKKDRLSKKKKITVTQVSTRKPDVPVSREAPAARKSDAAIASPTKPPRRQQPRDEPAARKFESTSQPSSQPAARSHRPWERMPDPKTVRTAEPMAGAPTPKGTQLRKLRGAPSSVNRSDDHTFSIDSFADARLGLLPPLVEVLKDKFGATNMTHIQRGAIPAIMRGSDVLLKARTGTGKTIAYLAPIVQWLATRPERVTRALGTYAIVVVPTRELALQVHDVLTQMVTAFHWIVPGLLIGGEKKKSEKARIRKGLTVVVGTPGRLADHAATTQCFNTTAIKFLVLDEADRLLDMGFERDISAISEFVRAGRGPASTQRLQTILVSATLDARVKQLAAWSLHTPVVASDRGPGAEGLDEAAAAEEARAASGQLQVPDGLRQHCMVVDCKRRLVSLCAFLRQRSVPASRPCKIIIFVASIAEVKFLRFVLSRAALPASWSRTADDAAPALDSDDSENEEEDGGGGKGGGGAAALLGVPVYELHGDLPQPERTAAFMGFTSSRRAILVCTDVAARGLDFPKIDWILQYDPPVDVQEYVHRCGRTARMTGEGDALLFLMPHEQAYLKHLEDHGLKLKTLPVESVQSVVSKAGGLRGTGRDEAFLALQRDLEDVIATAEGAADLARDAYSSFVRAYATHGRATKPIFHPKSLHLGHVAASFALREQPARIKAAQRRTGRADPSLRHRRPGRGGAGDEDDGGAGGKRRGGAGSWGGRPAKYRKRADFDADANLGICAL